MSHEFFVIERREQLDQEESERVAYLRDKLSTAENLGLSVQAAAIIADIATIERGRLITTAPMSDTELVIWRAWLPTAYTDNGDQNSRHKLADYQFDRVPGPVLKAWEKYKQSGMFERFEIWTPEVQQPDPILVGVNGNSRHLLARWGESDANLMSFDDIKRELVRRWYGNERIANEGWNEHWARLDRGYNAFTVALVASSGIGMAAAVAAGVLSRSAYIGWGVAVAVAVASGVAVYYYARRYMTDKLLLSSGLMQAIAKDDSRPRDLLPT